MTILQIRKGTQKINTCNLNARTFIINTLIYFPFKLFAVLENFLNTKLCYGLKICVPLKLLFSKSKLQWDHICR